MMHTCKSCEEHREGKGWLRLIGVGTLLVGWVFWQRLQRHLEQRAYPEAVTTPATSPDAEEKVTPPTEAAPEEPQPPEPTAPPTESPKTSDDLTRIEGIGPKVAAVLHDAGIDTYMQLAQSEVEELREILRAVGLAFMNPTTWPEQAELAASGEETALTDLQAELKGGQRS
jgi:predicted flap endonuclease-1-like 5' DNA nuclease